MKIGSILIAICAVLTGSIAVQKPNAVKIVDALVDTDEISPKCLESLKLYAYRLNSIGSEGDLWALKMLDATSKMPVGLLSYNFGEMGNFKQCTEIVSQRDRVKGKYCLGNVVINTTAIDYSAITRNYAYVKRLITKISDGVHMVGYPTWAICLPSNCTDEDAKYVMGKSQTLGTGIDSVICQTIEDVNPPLDNAAIIGISILSVLVVIVIMSTIYDIYCQNIHKDYQQSASTAFSVYTNGKKLFQVPKRLSPLSCLDGIRVISMIWIVMLHTYSVYTTGPVFNSKDVVNLTNSLISMVFLNGSLACDTFLIVGGTLVTYVFFKKEKSSEINVSSVARHYFHRYMRLTPALAGVVLVSATLLKYMGSGPKWPNFVQFFQGFCTQYWWTSILYIQNEVNSDQMCAGHTWYLDVDMQLYILSPFIFWMLKKYTKTGLAFLVFGTLSSISIGFFRAFEDELSGLQTNYYSKTPFNVYMNDYYLKTETRAAPWFIGTILGYMLTRKTFRDSRISKHIVIPMWFLSLTVMLLCVLGGHSTLRGPEYHRLENAFYIALVRPSFALAVGWIIWACATNHGGFINTALSHGVFQFLNKFIYSMYLLHVTCLYMIMFSQKRPLYMTIFNLAYWFWGIFMLMFGLSIIWVLVFESPMIVLERIIISKLKKMGSKSSKLNNQAVSDKTKKGLPLYRENCCMEDFRIVNIPKMYSETKPVTCQEEVRLYQGQS
ncbi:unnamed protein product [Diabrotica balteata]|uniref:Nose resistant-to-fluoxetine protein N-terminal domain-containing protein n=1 Tax=Diabrotica balteata TaxID=107213 RepID=A0A9N9SYD4_DIABA|nr:unnamed protein product [Diabrotica balteata]